MTPDERDAARDLMAFIDAAPTPFHAVAEAMVRLEAAGFTRLDEQRAWRLAPGDRRYLLRNDSSLAAFVVGSEDPAEAGFALLGAHTDSPNLRLKPRPVYERDGYRQLGVETYGGALLATWFDRDLGIAGRVFVRLPSGALDLRLVRSEGAIARIPSLAIHLEPQANDQGVGNKQQVLPPIVGRAGEARDFAAWLREAAEIAADEDVAAFELMLFPIEPSRLGGLDGSFLHAPRLDNLASCHAGLTALIATADAPAPAGRVVILYDHEEVGSTSAQGASGSLGSDLLERLTVAGAGAGGGGAEASVRARARSMMISADMAHGVHPNWPDKHDPHHRPVLNGGPCVKVNANARYATNAATQARFRELARDAGVGLQDFVMRTDMGCGSTIGPLVAAGLGIPTIDVGNPMLSMHSCRETAGARDHEAMIRVLVRFFS